MHDARTAAALVLPLCFVAAVTHALSQLLAKCLLSMLVPILEGIEADNKCFQHN